jgi:hypothetical protein
MGWELRHGTRLYLYRNRRENGRPVKKCTHPADHVIGV